jgi:fatty-acid desaturase
MTAVAGPPRITADERVCAEQGNVHWAPAKSLWIGTMTAVTVVLAPVTIGWSAIAVFVALSAVTLCFGHSVGMHRRLIHGSFACPLWLERFCVYLGTLVGMAGPFGMIRQHDLRDWAQRQPRCHDYFCHRRPLWQDAWWQLHCALVLRNPPSLRIEPRVAEDRFYVWLERTWMLQQLPLAIVLYGIGGLPWLIWGIPARVTVCVGGHWLVGHFAHRRGPRTWIVDGAGVQGYNVPIAALISMGESWHNNHHAFPESAKLGLHRGEWDPGWWLIRTFERLGLAWNIRTPETLPSRAVVRRFAGSADCRRWRPVG